jgi:hypothetical protein
MTSVLQPPNPPFTSDKIGNFLTRYCRNFTSNTDSTKNTH